MNHGSHELQMTRNGGKRDVLAIHPENAQIGACVSDAGDSELYSKTAVYPCLALYLVKASVYPVGLPPRIALQGSTFHSPFVMHTSRRASEPG